METFKVIYNSSHGGFYLSDKALKAYNDKLAIKNMPPISGLCMDMNTRVDLDLIEIIEELGSDANGKYSNLKIHDVPVEYQHCYRIEKYDACEHVIYGPKALAVLRLSELDLTSLTDSECRFTLEYLKSLVNIS